MHLSFRGFLLLHAPTTCLGMVQEPKHRALLLLGTLPGAPASPPPARAGLALTRGLLAAVPGLFPKFICKRVVSSSPKGPTLPQLFSASSAYVNTAFDVSGITHIHVYFLPRFSRRKRISNCQFISISQHLCACWSGRSASTCSRTHTCLANPEVQLWVSHKYLCLGTNNCEELSSCRTH